MKSNSSWVIFSALAASLLVLSACAAATPQASSVRPSPLVLPIIVTETSTQPAVTVTVESSPTKPVTTPTFVPSPTQDTRLLPEQWQEWPIVPGVTARAREIYALGQTLGVNPNHFSKVGDCQSIYEAFMGLYDLPGRYTLTGEDAHLQDTVDQFKGSFERNGMAVHGGFTAASPLSPLLANPDFCDPGETPLECEFRVHQPVIVFINMEVWWDGRTPETYAKYMRQLIDFAIAKGAVPILATKADNVEGDHSINLATAELAYEYDLPLWNFWRAVQPLSNHGLRDRFHISYEAWTPRSFTGLQALDSIWTGLNSQP